jgi:hypothetical protein
MADGDAMQTDDAMDVVASKASASGLQIKLHPLVLVNIADHITKLRVQTSNPDPLGMLCYAAQFIWEIHANVCDEEANLRES